MIAVHFHSAPLLFQSIDNILVFLIPSFQETLGFQPKLYIFPEFIGYPMSFVGLKKKEKVFNRNILFPAAFVSVITIKPSSFASALKLKKTPFLFCY